MGCDCKAFPHKKKPREFWISLDFCNVSDEEQPNSIHVREIVNISESEMNDEAEKWTNDNQNLSSFGYYRAGYLAAIAKMRGGE